MSKKQDVQDFLRAQLGFSEHATGLDFAAAEKSCSVFAAAYNADAHMTRVYCCRPLDETNFVEEQHVFGTRS